MKIYQPHLPFNEAGDSSKQVAEISVSGTVDNWWYIEKLHCPHKCLYADEGGTYYFGSKELSRVVPVVWNLRREATRVARKHAGRVKKFPYKLKAR